MGEFDQLTYCVVTNKKKKKEEELREKRFGSRIHKTFKLDFAGRQIVDERDAPGAGINYASFSNEVDAILNDKVELLPAQTSNLNADAVSNITLQVSIARAHVNKILMSEFTIVRFLV